MASYDERLLAAAPAATREERQEGYKVDLLTEDATRRTGSSSPEAHVPPLASNHGHAEAALASKEQLPSYPSRRAVPWWRTKKWITIFVLFAIVAIAAIVGGAVGGTVNKHHDNDSSSNSTQPATSGGNGGEASPTGSGGGQIGGAGPAGQPQQGPGQQGASQAGSSRPPGSATQTSALTSPSDNPNPGIGEGADAVAPTSSAVAGIMIGSSSGSP